MVALSELTIAQMRAAMDAKEISSRDLVETCLGRIAETAGLGAFLTVDEAGARAKAAAADDRRRRAGPSSPLDGVPIALKDNHVTEGVVTTAGSKILEGWCPPYDATVVRRLADAGAIVIGKTNMDEFAMGSSNEHSAYGPVHNPWNPALIPGGSSGGGAVAVAARQVPGSFGTDTGGSIRQPAAMCGVYGLKPTYGRVSRYGIVAFASSLDQVGPFGRTAADVATLLQAVAGFDPKDSTSAQAPVPDYAAALHDGVEGIRIGVPAQYFAEGIDPEVDTKVRESIDELGRAGAQVVPIELPHTEYALSTYYLIATAEASSNLGRYDGVRYGLRVEDRDLQRMIARSRNLGFGEEVQRRIILGTFVLSAGYYDAYYRKAQKVRTLIRRDFERAFDSVDLIATPTSPVTAFPLGARTDDPLSMYLADVCTLAVNLAGVPALSVPAGLSSAGLPIGLQLIGPWFGEERLLSAAQNLENRTDSAQLRPPC